MNDAVPSSKDSFRNSEKRCILNIFRMTTHNGPGIRTLVQFKGCPLQCLWCSTPESQNADPEIAISPEKCTQCGKCVPVCHADAITLTDNSICIDRSLCDSCGKCANVCSPEAIQLLGVYITVEELLEEILRDKVFYKHSGGGVTLSGGEPLHDPLFTEKLLIRLKKENVSVGVDTCGYAPFEIIEPMLQYIDFFLWDIKHMDKDVHKSLTGESNILILNNARLVSERNIPLYIRIPIIPGYNDSEENINATVEFAKSIPSLVAVELMPLHHLGKARYDRLNRAYPISDALSVQEYAIQHVKNLIQSHGIKCNIIV